MKKILFIFFLFLFTFIPALQVSAEEKATDTLVVHYYRYQNDYNGWNFWIWPYAPVNGDGYAYQLAKEGTTFMVDDFGAYSVIKLSETTITPNSTAGIIVRRGEWVEKDISIDRHFFIPATSENGEHHIYLVQNDTRIGTSLNDPNGPDKSHRILSAYFNTAQTIRFNTTKSLTKEDLVLTEDGIPLDFTLSLNGFVGTITLSKNVDLSKTYVLTPTFDGEEKPYTVTFDGIYDSPEFEEAFGYAGDDLGAIVTDNQTAFRLWAPISSSVTLNIYSTGTPASLPGGSNTPIQQIPMTKDVKGTWVATVNENLHGKYYTYSVTNGNATHEVIDPYAKSAGVNGVRGMVVDFSEVNPLEFEYGKRANNITNPTDAIIYELHVRDLTTHSSWNGSEVNRGKYLGLIEEGTTYNGVTTGFDHIKELGVTHVQLLPFFDFGVVDESQVNNPGYKNAFNWGYMPLNFNVLEGSYSANPYDGSIRIREMKQAVTAFTKNNIRLVMDVVYNHTGLSADSNFHLILPGYYHRMTSAGAFSNGSGTGNETASERFMMRKFIVDSVKFWATEYNISGFRFDLMALHDLETMKLVEQELRKIDSTILVYGEPWMGGTSTLPGNLASDKQNLAQIPNVAAFNDDFRDGVRGSVFDGADTGFVQGNANARNIERIKYGIVGGIAYPGLATGNLSYQKIWHTSPSKTINYVSAHDNNTLHDKLRLSTASNQKSSIPFMAEQAGAFVLTSQGIPFIHAGAEMLRSKPKEGGGYDENSYESPDSVNQIRWDLKAKQENLDVFNYYKGLIALRKAHPAFRMTSAGDVSANLEFVYQNQPKLIAYMINNNANGDSWDKILVVHNSSFDEDIVLPGTGKWYLVGAQNKVGTDVIRTFSAGETVSVWQYETKIFFQDADYNPNQGDEPPVKKGCSFGATVIFLNLMSLGALSVYVLRRKH
ncbi:MAG TPA: type I pullulanase [Acholeplasmataceae bacterium]|jgi:pullulanase|nr:type I pullulanase [Acholeplasmataceae bacterium]